MWDILLLRDTRHTAYVSRHASQLKKVIVMITSALWHGLYPGTAYLMPIAPPSSRGTLPSSPPPTGYYCTFLLASFWSEAEKKLFVAVAPVSKVRLIFCDTVLSVVADDFAKLLPKAVSSAVSVVWTILLLNYMTVR